MTSLQLQIAFQREMDQYENAPKYSTNDILYWLNQSVNKYIENYTSGSDIRGESLEETTRVANALDPLVVESTIVSPNLAVGTIKPNSYTANLASLSSTYRHRLSEEVTISYTDDLGQSVTKRQGITECTSDRYSAKINDPYSEHRLHYGEAKPLRLFRNSLAELITDGNYSITAYYIRYLKEPSTITYSQTCDLASFIHSFIVKQAVDMALENSASERYKTHLVETKTTE